MNKTKLLTISLLAIFLFSTSGQTAVMGQSQAIETNFELYYYTSSGSRITESYALYIKQALAPLGIDVVIFAKPFGQFVGDLLHSSSGRPFDIAHVRFVGGGATPEFAWHYASDQYYYGGAMLQLQDPDWQAWQLEDVGLNNTDIDNMIYNIDFDMDLAQRYDDFKAFNQLYFDKLLYDLPVIALESRTSMWKGYGGATNELWNPDEGIMGSRAFGAKWTADTPAARKGDANEMVLSTTVPQKKTFDPGQSTDSATTDITRYMTSGLLTFDNGYLPHPDIAYNYLTRQTPAMFDDDNNATTPDVSAIKMTFLLRDDAYFAATTDKDGNPVATKMVDANDFKLALDYWMIFTARDDLSVNGEYLYSGLFKDEVSTTITTNDTISLWYYTYSQTPDDVFKYGGFSPLPSHLLGGDLHYHNETSGADLVAPLDINIPFDPQLSAEWKQWATLEGHSLTGPYEITDFQDDAYSYVARSDYYFPNEWDVQTYYDAAKMAALETEYNTTLDTWGPTDTRMVDHQAAWNWAFAGSETDHTKPTSQGIEKFTWLVIVDINNRLIKFDAGELDAFAPVGLGADVVASQSSNPNYVVKAVPLTGRGPELLVLNLLNPHLKKYNVRRAISLAIDRDVLIQIHDGFAKAWYSIADPYSGIWDEIQATNHAYSYEAARDLMRSEGYKAADSNKDIGQASIPQPGDVANILGLPGFEFYIALMSVFVAVPIVRRKRN
jgi:hypothetical protein